MTILLNNFRLLEENHKHKIYQCLSPDSIQPGEQLQFEDTKLEVLRCRQNNNEFHLVIQAPLMNLNVSDITAHVIGEPFSFTPHKPVYLFAESTGINICLHWLDNLRQEIGDKQCKSLIECVIFHQRDDFSFRPTPSTFMLRDLPSYMIAAVPLLEDLGIPSRLSCDQFQPGCFEGSLSDLMQATDCCIAPESWLGFVSEQTKDVIYKKIGEPEFIFELPA